jgi:putative transposase
VTNRRSTAPTIPGIDEIVLSLTAKGLTTGEVAAYFADIYGATVSKDTISGSPTR